MPTSKQRALRRAVERLDPAQGLDTIDAAAARVTSALMLTSTLVGGFGLVSAAELANVGIGWAIPSVLAAATSAALAVWATFPMASTLRPGDLSAVEWWFDRQIKRRVCLVRAAGLAFAVALALASLPTVVAAIDSPAPTLGQQLVVDGDGSVSARVSIDNAPAGSRVTVEVVSGARRLASAAGRVDADGRLDIALDPDGSPRASTAMTTVVTSDRRVVGREVSRLTPPD